jgi:hypothetical protein
VAFAIAMNGAVLLVTDVLFEAPTEVIATVGVGALFLWLWFGIGLWRRWRR